MHMFRRAEKNFYGGHGIVGAQVAYRCTGLALAGNSYRDTDESVAFSDLFRRGRFANQGQVYESFNMAAALEVTRHICH